MRETTLNADQLILLATLEYSGTEYDPVLLASVLVSKVDDDE